MLKEDIAENFQGFSWGYQPIVDGETKEIIGAEMLLYWERSELFQLELDEMIQILEKNRLLNKIGRWMFQTGCETLGVCLEGVKDAEQLKLVEDMVFDYMQGELFGKATDTRLTFK